jgi:tetratricopeptide (TPR) repeat protein
MQAWCRPFFSMVLFGCVARAAPARAQAPAASDVARAETLFQEGRQLMRDGRFAEACRKLEESEQLDPAPGTRLNLADCWERAGRTASAQREFLRVAESAEAAGEKERASIARERANQLVPKLTKLVLLVPRSARVPGLALFQDSTPVPETEWEVPRPIDPGSTVVEARAPGYFSYKVELRIASDAATHRVTLPRLVATGPRKDAPDAPTSTTRGEWLQGSGLAFAGLGLAGLAVGAVFGVRAVSLYDESRDQGCNERDQCPAGALATRDSAVRHGNVATASFVIGGALLAGGAGLYVWGARERARERSRLTASFRPLASGGGLVAIDSRF